MKNFVIAFHVCCETKEQAHQWQMSALQILDQNTHALGYKPDETGDLNCHCSGHADEENGEEEIPPPIPAPVVSTAAPEPPNRYWDIFTADDGSRLLRICWRKNEAGNFMAMEIAEFVTWNIATVQAKEEESLLQVLNMAEKDRHILAVAPESYKPEAVAKQTVSTVFPVQQTAVSFSPFFAPAGPEKLKHTNCDQNDCAACEVPLPEGVCGQKANSDSADVVLSQGNASGCTAATTWAIGSTLTEATIRPIPQPPCSECATLQEKLEIAQRYGQREYAIEQILRGDLSTAVAECATLRKERDEAKAEILRLQKQNEKEECTPCECCASAIAERSCAEAQLSTLRDELLKSRQLKNKLLKSLSRKHRQQGQRAQELDQLKRKLAALAPTPEIAPEGKL